MDNNLQPTTNSAPDSGAYKKFNPARTLGKVMIIFRMLGASVFTFIMLIITLAVYHKTHSVKMLLILSVFVLAGLLIVVLSALSYKKLSRKSDNPALGANEFQGPLAVKYKTPEPAAKASGEEKIEGWMGPVNRTGWGAVDYSITQEVQKAGENTLLFTNKQIIGLMLGPEDFASLKSAGAVQSIVGNVVENSLETANDKGIQSDVLYRNKWPDLVQNLMSQPLQSVLKAHLNFGIPYSAISDVKIKNTFVNPGAVINLKDGHNIPYGTTKKDQLSGVAEQLKKFITVS